MAYSPLVQKKIDRLKVIAEMTRPENIAQLKEGGKASQIMIEVRRLQMELMGFQSTTHLEGSSRRLNVDIVDTLHVIKGRIADATGELFFDTYTREDEFINKKKGEINRRKGYIL